MEFRRTILSNAIIKAGIGSNVGPDVVEAIFNNRTRDRIGDEVMPEGCDNIDEINRRGLIVLWQHDGDYPIARTTAVWKSDGNIKGRIKFPPQGTSEKSAEALRLIKAGVVDSVSIGFQPHQWEPIKGSMGLRFTAWSLLEISFVSVPALPSAVVTAKSGAKSATPNLDAMRAALARLKSGRDDRDYRALIAARAAERVDLRRRADIIRLRAELDVLRRAGRAEYERMIRRWP
jgi:HK97 family phage prohead protease